MKPKATYQDVYNHLSLQEWKTFLGIKKELEIEGKSAGHLRGIIYVQLAKWEEQGFVRSRLKGPNISGQDNYPRQREYQKNPNGIPEEFRQTESQLEAGLSPVFG